jgi:hypothetical protein
LVALVEVYSAPYGVCGEFLWIFSSSLLLTGVILSIMGLAMSMVAIYLAGIGVLGAAALLLLLLGASRQYNIRDRRRLEKELAQGGAPVRFRGSGLEAPLNEVL